MPQKTFSKNDVDVDLRALVVGQISVHNATNFTGKHEHENAM